jgi:hypothetical protein
VSATDAVSAADALDLVVVELEDLLLSFLENRPSSAMVVDGRPASEQRGCLKAGSQASCVAESRVLRPGESDRAGLSATGPSNMRLL